MMITNKQAREMLASEWNMALAAAADVVIRATGIPPGARNPERDRLVIEGEHIARRIMALRREDSPTKGR